MELICELCEYMQDVDIVTGVGAFGEKIFFFPNMGEGEICVCGNCTGREEDKMDKLKELIEEVEASVKHCEITQISFKDLQRSTKKLEPKKSKSYESIIETLNFDAMTYRTIISFLQKDGEVQFYNDPCTSCLRLADNGQIRISYDQGEWENTEPFKAWEWCMGLLHGGYELI